jgi:peroxiredoxin
MDAAMRSFGPGTVDIEETLYVDQDKPPKQVRWHLKMNGWTDYIETLGSGKEAITHYESERGAVQFAAADKWYFRSDGTSGQSPLALAGTFPPQARPDGWQRPIAKPVLEATRVVATKSDGEPAWRIEFPVDTMRRQVEVLTLSFFAPPLRSITIGRDDHLPRAWTGIEEAHPSHASYRFHRAPRPYTAAEMAFRPTPGMLEVGFESVNGRGVGAFKGNAPDFSLKSALGRAPVRLSHLRGRPVLLVLRASRADLETARRFFRDFHDRGLAVLVVTTDTPAAVRKALPKGGLPFPVLSDQDGRASAPYRAGNVEMVLIGKDGTVRASGRLAHDIPRFRALLKAMP